MRKVALLIDGGYLRQLTRKAKKPVDDPSYIERVAHVCIATATEELHRALYYDCPPFHGEVRQAISKTTKVLGSASSGNWLKQLAQKDLFAVRKGELKFRGWDAKALDAGVVPTDADFTPRFQQKGVDMRIGLDIANISGNRSVDRIALLTGDNDFIPAMKYARTKGLQIVALIFPNERLTGSFQEHVDIRRAVAWP